MHDKRVQWAYRILDTFFTFIRVMGKTRFSKTVPISKKKISCLVCGNGPSLSKSLYEIENKLENYDIIVVNFMALSPEYQQFKPKTYVLCDPAFWLETNEQTKTKVMTFYRHLSNITHWEIQLYIPYESKKVKEINQILSANKKIQIVYYNKTKIEGFKSIQYPIINKQWGMFKPQNVLVAALMLAIYSKYENIYLVGAESDFLMHVWVDNENKVRMDDYHFYKEKPDETKRIISEFDYANLVQAFLNMFKSYNCISLYAKQKKINIINATPFSNIDAFERGSIK